MVAMVLEATATEPTVTAMGSLLGSLGAVATGVWAQITKIASTIVGTPLLLFTVGFLFLGGCIGIFGRLLSLFFGGYYGTYL